jgi:SARP family transcriptional regulator, regulator of embCAB operon
VKDVCPDVTIELLGPFSVRVNRAPVMPRAAKPRQVLALLALNAGRFVTVSSLIDELWGDNPPPSALTTLQTYIMECRRWIAAAPGPHHDPKKVLRTWLNGYLLDCPEGRVDVRDFERLAQSGRAAAERGDYRNAAEILSQALALWRGAALVDVRKGRILELETAALEEARLAVLSRRIKADLALARHADILGELTALVARHPLNESLSALLITALYRTGHTGRALEAFHELRRSLVTELGIEPSAQLQRLQYAVLHRDPSLDAA